MGESVCLLPSPNKFNMTKLPLGPIMIPIFMNISLKTPYPSLFLFMWGLWGSPTWTINFWFNTELSYESFSVLYQAKEASLKCGEGWFADNGLMWALGRQNLDLRRYICRLGRKICQRGWTTKACTTEPCICLTIYQVIFLCPLQLSQASYYSYKA